MRRVFQVDDVILYGGNGVCRVDSITKREFGGKEMEYYVLQPVYSNGSFIYVPADNEKLTGKMRLPMSQDELRGLIHEMAQDELPWIENDHERKEACRSILATGEPHAVTRMLQALYRHQEEQKQKGKKLHQADERFFHEAEKLLYDELALVLHIQPDQVQPFLRERIEEELCQTA